MLPKNLTTLTFGLRFNWMDADKYYSYKHHIKMVDNISIYYHVKLFLEQNMFCVNWPNWPVHVVNYRENYWSAKIYEIQDKYVHPIHGPITKLINKKHINHIILLNLLVNNY